MKKTALLSVILVASIIFGGESGDIHSFIDDALVSVKMRESDLSQISLISGPLRLALVDSCMDRPLDMPAMLDSFGTKITDPGADPYKSLDKAFSLMGFKIDPPVVKSPQKDYPWKGNKDIPVRLREAMDLIFAAFEQSSVEFNTAFSEVDSFQMDTIKTFGLSYITRDAALDLHSERGGTSLEDFDKLQLEAEKRSDRIFNITAKIDRTRIASATAKVFKAALSAREKVEGITAKSAGTSDVPDSIAGGDIIYWCETDFGLVAIGGLGRTTYKKRFALIIDLGGDDSYLEAAGGANPHTKFSVCIDMAGDDLYSSRSHYAFGSGGLGIGILLDEAGNDLYKTGHYSIASGCFGSGILLDKAGDDKYIGESFTQGAGFVGFGLLLDRAGNDLFRARSFAQGFGFVGGVGILADSYGNDSYIAQGSQNDTLRYAGHHLSLAQGFGYGNRPDWSGGIGFLLDRSGNDVYIADIFGQGSSYWLALGGLWDGAGNDSYTGYQYCQGTSTHLSAAMMMDKSGDDSYISKGVSQGAAHDMAVAYFLDLDGDDNYIVHDLSRGAGNANAVGIFIDYSGDDGYVAKSELNVQGFGDWRRDFGSIGIMLDCQGLDSYSRIGGDSSWWSSGKYGIGIDFPADIKEIKH